MSDPAPRDFTEEGRLLFAGPCDFIWAAAKIDGLPPMGPPEIAFAGRSNVGKSSLINALTGRKTLARVSQTPGRTREINFFNLGGKLMLVYYDIRETRSQSFTQYIDDKSAFNNPQATGLRHPTRGVRRPA